MIDELLLKESYLKIYTKGSLGFNDKASTPNMQQYINYLGQSRWSETIKLKHMVELISSLSHINNHYVLADLLDLAYHKKYYEFCDLFYSPSHNAILHSNLLDHKDITNVHILNNTLFLVINKQKFIHSIREKGYNVNEGPQKWRGQINIMNNILNNLDNNYRYSLYNHYIYHKSINSIPDSCKPYVLTKKHFYFRNIHQNMGNVK